MKFLDIGGIISGVGKIADNFHTSDKERLELALAEKQLDASLVLGQQQINQIAAKHKSVWVAGWRPAIGWVGALGLLYQFMIYPLLMWAFAAFAPELTPPPNVDTSQLYPLITAMLGIAGMRSFDKVKNVSTEKL